MKKSIFKIAMLFPFIGFAQNSTVYITNEGNFGTGNGSLSIYDKTSNSVTNDVFSTVNSAYLGDVVQSMEFFDGKGYVCVNGSAKIEVIDENATYIATIAMASPRYLKQVNATKAYVTDWGINGVQVIDLTTNTVTSTIACGAGPEGIAVSNGFAYVCNVGAWGLDSTVTIINTTTDAVETTLTVGDKPNSAVVDANGNVWVLTGGYTEYDANWNVVSETPGVLAMINTTTNTIDVSYTFTVGNHPEDLVINGAGDKLYYSDGSWSKAVYEFGINDSQLAVTPIINKSFYGLGYDPISNEIYGSDAVDFTQQGWVFRYATTGAVVDSFQVGIIPGGFAFRQDVLGVSDMSTASISVYPNPSSGRFFINSSELINSITVRNILGAVVNSVVVSSLSDVIDLTAENKGIYLVDIKTNSGTITKKLIVE
ncbi:MAG: T9SS type A sorting domain-containing protein [Flavobacteriales bacterium]|nr:T9SS type A sorting domain-containing protein [Flavobacteriales bacterium]